MGHAGAAPLLRRICRVGFARRIYDLRSGDELETDIAANRLTIFTQLMPDLLEIDGNPDELGRIETASHADDNAHKALRPQSHPACKTKELTMTPQDMENGLREASTSYVGAPGDAAGPLWKG
tara:strand:+ start:667 stop:1035 length:369 start_codon:yes stop_codon:yes gene_type:complete